MAETVQLSNFSRYKDTAIYKRAGKNVFGLFEIPTEFTTDRDDYIRHKVAPGEIGFLDKIALEYYGEGMEDLWWVISFANTIIDPDEEMYVGQILDIPPRSAVLQFLSRRGRRAL